MDDFIDVVAVCVKRLVHFVALSRYHNRLRYDYDEKLTCSFFARVKSRRSQSHGSRRGSADAADHDVIV